MEIFGLNLIKSIIIILVVLFYWKFVYYKYHTKSITPISFFVFGGISFFIGTYNFIKGNVNFKDIELLFYFFTLLGLFSFISVIYAINKHGLKNDVDITLTWAKKIFPFMPYYFWVIVSFPVFFFIMLTTYYLLGQEHIIFWGLITIAWIRSNIRLYRKEIMK